MSEAADDVFLYVLLMLRFAPQVPEFTTSKWGCIKEGCAALQCAIQRPTWRPWQLRRPQSPLEKFLEKSRELMKGVTDDSDPKKPKYHPHRKKINLLSGLLEQGWLHAGVAVVLDLWDKSYDDFFAFCKSPSRFGQFPSPHLRHMMAEQVAKDKVFYDEGLAEPVCRQAERIIPHLLPLLGLAAALTPPSLPFTSRCGSSLDSTITWRAWAPRTRRSPCSGT